MAALAPMPSPAVAMVDGNGMITPEWLLYFRSREKVGIANLSDVSTTAPANNQVLIYNSTTLKWTPGAN